MGATAPGASLRLVPVREAGAIRVVAAGELDVATAPDLEGMIETTLRLPGVRDVVIDCAGLTFIDAAGLGALVRCWWSLREHDRSLTVCGPRGDVARVLALTKVGEELGLPRASR